MSQIFVEIGDCCVDRNLILPLKVLPHLSEFGVRASGRQDVVHDVNVNGVEHYDVASGRCVVYWKEMVLVKTIIFKS